MNLLSNGLDDGGNRHRGLDCGLGDRGSGLSGNLNNGSSRGGFGSLDSLGLGLLGGGVLLGEELGKEVLALRLGALFMLVDEGKHSELTLTAATLASALGSSTLGVAASTPASAAEASAAGASVETPEASTAGASTAVSVATGMGWLISAVALRGSGTHLSGGLNWGDRYLDSCGSGGLDYRNDGGNGGDNSLGSDLGSVRHCRGK